MDVILQKYRETILYLILLVVLTVAGIMQIKPKAQTFFQLKNDIAQKKIQITELETKIAQSKEMAIKMERARINNSVIAKSIFNPQNLSLEKDAGYSVLFSDIFQMAKTNKIKTYSVDYNYDPQEDPFVKSNQGYSVCELNMKLIGAYADFEGFLKDLYKYPYFISISDYDVMPYYRDKSILLIKLSVKVYMKG